MRIGVFGSGGVGGYFGGRLAQAGADVVFVARGEHLRAMQAHGLRIRSILGDVELPSIQAVADPATAGEVDAVILGVKAWQVREAAEAVAPMVGSDTVVVPLQNGIEATDHLSEVLGPAPVAGGLCRIISYIESPGVIRHAGANPFIAFGELDDRPSRRIDELRAAFSGAAGLRVAVKPNIRAAMWEKFLMISAWSGLGAVARAPIGVLCNLEETRRMLHFLMEEVFRLARARQIEIREDAVEQAMTILASAPAGATASMQRDIEQGRPSELMEQNGAVVRLGRESGVTTPLNEWVVHSLLPRELKARGHLSFEY